MLKSSPAKVDEAVEASLPPSVRSSLAPKWREWTDPKYGYDCELIGFEMDGAPPANDVHAAVGLLRKAVAPAPTRVIASEIARLRVMTKSRAESDEDLHLMAAAYVEELASYPADVVIDACRTWARREKFWPSWHELKELLDHRVKKRRAMLEALERAQ